MHTCQNGGDELHSQRSPGSGWKMRGVERGDRRAFRQISPTYIVLWTIEYHKNKLNEFSLQLPFYLLSPKAKNRHCIALHFVSIFQARRGRGTLLYGLSRYGLGQEQPSFGHKLKVCFFSLNLVLNYAGHVF